ncbi:MAG: hypothetical protein M1822_007299 [Bathelium mastoideum]|nr:MAG: hypothetical protein M1822_007299 [Bathelium mastoideum]
MSLRRGGRPLASENPSSATTPAAPCGARKKRSDLTCAGCNRRFSKPEHLRRHERVHSGVKPFACSFDGCTRRFNRPDSLSRHYKTHKAGNSNSAGETSTPPSLGSENGQYIPIVAGPSLSLDDQTQSGVGNATPIIPEMPIDAPPASMDRYAMYPWPESENLFALLASDVDYSFLDMSISTSQSRQTAEHSDPDERTSAHARQAVHNTSSLVQEFSFNLLSEVEALGVTADFLDLCLNGFFLHLLPVFPVFHEPTFKITNCMPPLLLNMIALGSLFVATNGATTTGEALWRVAHAAVATSWQILLSCRYQGGHEKGMQLVMTALLSQVYAVLSGNQALRLTSQAFRGLGFFWARESDLFSSLPTSNSIASVTAATKMEKWKEWADQEARSRVLMGHYILDGLISQSSGLPSSARHTINNMAMPCSDEAFDAPTCDDWLRIMTYEQSSSRLTFRELLLQLFDFDVEPPTAPLTHMSVPVVMEALESLIAESREAGGPSVGLPTMVAIGRALWRLRESQITNPQRLPADVLDLSIRWHVVCMSLCVEPRNLMHALCQKHGVDQKIYSGAITPSKEAFVVGEWQASHLARRAMLHALAVLDLVQQMTFSKMRALHIPSALHSAAIVLIAVADTNSNRMHLPKPVCWKTVCELGELDVPCERQPSASSSTSCFLTSGTLPSGGQSKARSIPVAINDLQAILESTTSTWGIAKEMHQSLRELMASRGPIS